MLTVADNGEGIGSEALPHIFERFYSGSASRSEATSHGLGLSIAQAIAQAHGSAIEALSTLGAGSKFSCLLKSAKGPVAGPPNIGGTREVSRHRSSVLQIGRAHV